MEGYQPHASGFKLMPTFLRSYIASILSSISLLKSSYLSFWWLSVSEMGEFY